MLKKNWLLKFCSVECVNLINWTLHHEKIALGLLFHAQMSPQIFQESL